jgi:hypothetical protein
MTEEWLNKHDPATYASRAWRIADTGPRSQIAQAFSSFRGSVR